MNSRKVSFGVFRVPFLFAAAQDEDRADGGDEKRDDEQNDADQKPAESDVFGRLVGRSVKRAHRDDDENDA